MMMSLPAPTPADSSVLYGPLRSPRRLALPRIKVPRRVTFVLTTVACLFSGCFAADDPPPATDDTIVTTAAPAPLEDPSFVPARTDLPVIAIQTQDGAPIVSKDDYINAQLTITNPDATVAFAGSTRIHGHGNSTWAMPKKPYKIKLDAKSALLGMPADKEWVLLANYFDKTLLRQQLAYETGARFGLLWSPRTRNVELFLNGQYEGAYTLVESIEVDKDRVNITELDSADTGQSQLSGGYLIEVNERMDEEVCFRSTLHVPFCIESPDEIAPAQLYYIQGYLQKTEDAIYGESFADPKGGYAQYIDIDSFVNWYLVEELFKNNDAVFSTSVYMYKDRNGKLAMGPVWDFDISAGNINNVGTETPDGWWIRNSPWYARLFEDPAFAARVQARWRELRPTAIATLFDFIDARAALLQLAQSNNFQRWLLIDKYVWPNAVNTGSYAGDVSYLKTWLGQRIAWLDAAFGL